MDGGRGIEGGGGGVKHFCFVGGCGDSLALSGAGGRGFAPLTKAVSLLVGSLLGDIVGIGL